MSRIPVHLLTLIIYATRSATRPLERLERPHPPTYQTNLRGPPPLYSHYNVM